MNIDIAELKIPGEFYCDTTVTKQTVDSYLQPYRLNFSAVLICISGEVELTVNTTDYKLGPNDLLALFPGIVVEFKSPEEGTFLSVACFSPETTQRVNPINVMAEVFHKMVGSPVLTLSNDAALYYQDYFSLLERLTRNKTVSEYTELAASSLQSILLGIRLIYKSKGLKMRTITRREEICKELIQLISKHYKNQRKAQFYADAMGVSLQHLSTTVKTVTNKNVLDIIASVVIMDAKTKLKNSRMTIQEVAYSLNFPSASFFGKYFRRYVGMTPLEYRKT